MKLQVMLLLMIATCLPIGAEMPRPSYARTMLKVARSLPGETEELKVRTSEGNVATLIVKRRDKSDHLNQSGASVDAKSENASRPEEKSVDGPTLFRLNPTISPSQGKIDYGSWTPLDVDGRALNAVESTTEGYVSWKPLPSDATKATTEERTNYGLVFARNFQERSDRELPLDSPRRIFILPHSSRPLTRTNIGANLSKNRGGKNVPPEVTVRSEINVKSLPKRTAMSIDADGTPVIHGKRVPDEPIDKIQTWRNARVINNKLVADTSTEESSFKPEAGNERQRFERFFQDVNRRYGRNFDDEPRNVYYEWDAKGRRNLDLNADIYETGNENFRSNIQKRMLHPESTHTYPNSAMYTPDSQKISPLTLKPGARAPVLQYAHPELGVQPAKILKSEKKRPDNFPENQNSFTEQRHKKKYVLNDKNVIDSYSTKNYYPNQHFYGLKQPSEPPFWVKLSENLKNQFSTGVERVSQLTKPVFDPLVEATQKISQNLGLSRNQEAQDKVGTVATGSSILLPALGLVASGAALGIGAVAVGRFLDVDVVKRANEEAYRDLEHQRALQGVAHRPYNSPIIVEDLKSDESQNEEVLIPVNVEEVVDLERVEKRQTRPVVSEGEYVMRSERKKRSLDSPHLFTLDTDEDEDRSKRLRRTGADSLVDIIEVDVPRRSKGDLLLIFDNNSLSPNEVDTSDPKSRGRRSVESDRELEDAFQNLENAEVAEVAHIDGDWTNTPCAKRIFCDAMIQRGADASILMEKKMDSLLRLIQPGAAVQVSSHFHEVMEAVRRHDCSRFLCPQTRPGNVFF